MSRFLTLIGFAKKSGQIVTGETRCAEGILKKKVSLLLVAEDLNEKTKNKMITLCQENQVSYCELLDKETLSHAIGKTNYGLFGITNKKMSRAILEAMQDPL